MKVILSTAALAAILVSGAAIAGNGERMGHGLSGPKSEMSAGMGRQYHRDDDHERAEYGSRGEHHGRARHDDDNEYRMHAGPKGLKHGMQSETRHHVDGMDDDDRPHRHGQGRGNS